MNAVDPMTAEVNEGGGVLVACEPFRLVYAVSAYPNASWDIRLSRIYTEWSSV